VALEIANELRQLGHKTWTYEENGLPGHSYLEQVHSAIHSCDTFVLLASTESLKSHQVRREAETAFERQKFFIPIRLKVTHDELQASPIFRMVSGTAVSLPTDGTDLGRVAEKIAVSLQVAGTRYEERSTVPKAPDDLPVHLSSSLSEIRDRFRGQPSPVPARIGPLGDSPGESPPVGGIAFACLLSVVIVVGLIASSSDILRSVLIWVIYVTVCGFVIYAPSASLSRVAVYASFPAAAFLLTGSFLYLLGEVVGHYFPSMSGGAGGPEGFTLHLATKVGILFVIAILTVLGVIAGIYARLELLYTLWKLNSLKTHDLKELNAKLTFFSAIVLSLLAFLLWSPLCQ
jgi:TIR domain